MNWKPEVTVVYQGKDCREFQRTYRFPSVKQARAFYHRTVARAKAPGSTIVGLQIQGLNY